MKRTGVDVMKKLEQLYEGKAKKVFATEDPDVVIVDYKDDATAFNGEKKGTIVGKGVINNRMTNYVFQVLEKEGVPTHYVEELSDRETAVKKVEIVPLEVIVRNVAAGSFSKRLGIEEGRKLLAPTLEFSYKDDDLGAKERRYVKGGFELMALITCENVSIGYEGQTVVKELNFSIERGDYLCIVGENGSGKSTLVKSLLGLKGADRGKIIYGDGLKKNEIGYLPQKNEEQKGFPASVYEVVLSGRLNGRGWKPFYRKEDKEAAAEKMEMLGITDLARQCFRDLSGGQQQRALLARALCATKSLLLLDEPVTGLDPIVTGEFYDLIRKINQESNIAVVMVSHDIETAVENASHILHLQETVRFFGTAEDYRKSRIGKKFLGGEEHD